MVSLMLLKRSSGRQCRKIPKSYRTLVFPRWGGKEYIMLYTNKELKVVQKEMKFGTVAGVTIGEYGCGRCEIFLPTPKEVEGVIRGLRADLTIGLSKSGRPRINRTDDRELYVILSSERNYTLRGRGCIKTPKAQENELIARGNGADGDTGRIGSWDAVILKAHEGDIFRVTWGGYGYGYPPTFYVVAGGKVYVADHPEVEDLYENLGIEIPFSLIFDGDRMIIATDEWKTV